MRPRLETAPNAARSTRTEIRGTTVSAAGSAGHRQATRRPGCRRRRPASVAIAASTAASDAAAAAAAGGGDVVVDGTVMLMTMDD